jgi:signal peptidase II
MQDRNGWLTLTDPHETDVISPNPNRQRAAWVMGVSVAVVLLVDQLTKIWAVAALEGQPPIQVVGTWFQFVFVRNPGAAFSLGGGSTIIVSILALVIVAVLLIRARHLGSVWWGIALGGMVGGALGNLIDRIFRTPGGLRGHVVDFLALPNWPVFNVADMAVVGSAILMVILVARGIEIDGTRVSKKQAADA